MDGPARPRAPAGPPLRALAGRSYFTVSNSALAWAWQNGGS